MFEETLLSGVSSSRREEMWQEAEKESVSTANVHW